VPAELGNVRFEVDSASREQIAVVSDARRTGSVVL
jgi:hypothetical protein